VKTVSDKVVKHSLACLSVLNRLVENVPLNVNFALSEPSLGALAMLISAFRKFDPHPEYSTRIAIITMEYEITDNVHKLN